MAGKQRKTELKKYPTYERAYLRAFEKMLLQHKNAPYSWKTGIDVMRWWLEEENMSAYFEQLEINSEK